jgi:hypothetical protein
LDSYLKRTFQWYKFYVKYLMFSWLKLMVKVYLKIHNCPIIQYGGSTIYLHLLYPHVASLLSIFIIWQASNPDWFRCEVIDLGHPMVVLSLSKSLLSEWSFGFWKHHSNCLAYRASSMPPSLTLSHTSKSAWGYMETFLWANTIVMHF